MANRGTQVINCHRTSPPHDKSLTSSPGLVRKEGSSESASQLFNML